MRTAGRRGHVCLHSTWRTWFEDLTRNLGAPPVGTISGGEMRVSSEDENMKKVIQPDRGPRRGSRQSKLPLSYRVATPSNSITTIKFLPMTHRMVRVSDGERTPLDRPSPRSGKGKCRGTWLTERRGPISGPESFGESPPQQPQANPGSSSRSNFRGGPTGQLTVTSCVWGTPSVEDCQSCLFPGAIY